MAGHGAAFDQSLDLGLDALCQLDFRAGHGNAVERRAPALDVLFVVGFGQFPEIDQARAGVGERVVHRIAVLGRVNAAVDRLVAEHVVDRLQDRRPRAERIGEGYRIEFQPGVLEFLLQLPAAQIEFARRGALERKDRLLLVADREHRAQHAVARAGTGGEFGNDVRDDVPLPRAGILRLVDQHVIDAAVELVMHPARGRRDRALRASCRSGRRNRAGRAPVFRGDSSPPPRSRYGAAPRCGRGSSPRGGARSAGRCGDSPLRTAGRWRDCCRRISWSPPICAARGRSSVRKTPRYASTWALPVNTSASRKPRRLVLIGFAAGVENAGDLLPARPLRYGPSTISRSTSSMRSLAATPSAADICAAAASAPPAASVQAMKWSRLRQASRTTSLKVTSAALAIAVIERPPVALSGLREASSSTARLARSIISFWSRSSSTAKRAGTLASNGNCCSSRVHSAWIVCTLSPPGVSSAQANSFRAALRSFARRMRDAGFADRRVQRVIIERHPVAQRREHPLGHVGGGGLGEGDAENFFRRHAVEQQPDHALHQHMRLARAGIGRHEGGGGRIRRARLCGTDGGRNGRGTFTIPPVASPPAADHSLIRARSS